MKRASSAAKSSTECFQLGLMGIEVPEEYGGQEGSFFNAVLAVEALSTVDPSAGVIVDVQNTLVNNALLRWGSDDQKKRYLPRLCRDTVGCYALSEQGSGSDAFGLATRAVETGGGFEITGRKLWITNAKEAGLIVLFANADPAAGYRGVTAFLIEKDFPGIHRRQEGRQARHSRLFDLRADSRAVPRSEAKRARRSGPRLQDRH